MSKVVVLGGCGVVGSVAVRTLAGLDEFSEVVIGDIDLGRARKLARQIGKKKVTACKVDAMSKKSVKAAIKGADIVLNCTGPFYLFVETILKAVIESKINYVDVCDDVDVTLDILKLDGAAKKAGITALIGMGSSPGVTNLLGKFAAENLLEETDSVDIYHAHGGEPTEGAGVIEHRFHCMSIDCPQFIDGKLQMVKFFEKSGMALQEDVDFPRIGEKVRVYPYPHPEQVTMPMHLSLSRVTNKGTVVPNEYYNLIKEICRLGLHTKEPLTVKGKKVIPYDFSIAYIIKEREKILKETNFGVQRGCVKVVAAGKKNGRPHKFVFTMASEGEALGEGTGIPAAFGVILMNRGCITKKGVLPPEACVNPMELLGLIGEVMKPEKGGKKFEALAIESIDADGKVERMQI
jgi:saccharopine dehydrogenase (NAD+, L-lysine-forming)